MALTDWTPLLVALATAGFGLLSYASQKRRDRKEELIKIRRIEYRKWIEGFHEVIGKGTPDTLASFNKATNDLFVFGSDGVVKAAGAFKKYMADTSPGRQARDSAHAGLLLAKVIQEMRRDCFEVSSLRKEEIALLLPFEGMDRRAR